MENLAAIDSKKGKNSLSKKIIRVDMTPMVDLGFLLITFFMFTTNFTKPNVIDLGLPAGEGGTEINIKNQLTFILGKDNRIFYYQTEANNLSTKAIQETKMVGMNVSKIISEYKKVAPSPEKFTIIIKPTDDANYKNFVDIIDEMALTQNTRYGISDLKPLEEKVYKEISK